MTTLKMYIADAFTKEVFKGNPAAVCVMDQWLPADVMQHIAIENNFSETAFAVKEGNGYGLRWFTPGGEIDLCGHATLGTSYVLAHFYEPGAAAFHFHTKSGELTVTHQGDLFSMDLPAYDMKRIPVTDAMAEAFGVRPVEAWLARDLVCVFASEDQVRNCQPDMEKVKQLDGLTCNITAPGREYDCVSRSFAPKLNVAEDPVCGSGHCHIIPVMAAKLGKNDLVAFQASKRTGVLYCHLENGRISMAGYAVLYSKAEISF
ncbi:MAG: PhzF family phenazine biosynthesis protein [Succiniclasticum sp.]|nr:PhzF family phenazine biosynthesis protein [Succiniclasticum sp.]MEE3478835.1 PhzF family phenazine biosynthesis protein [Succiniclasticum sp.]